MTSEEQTKLVSDHWGYIWRVLVHHGVSWIDRHKASKDYIKGFHDGLNDKQMSMRSFHYVTAYEHGVKHRLEEAE